MTGADDALRAVLQLAGALAARAQDVLPRLHDVERGVADAWPDAGGVAWVERAAQVRRALERDLDTADALTRAARALLDAPAEAGGAGAAPSAPPLPGVRPAPARSDRDRGAHLGATDAARADDGPGMRLGAAEG